MTKQPSYKSADPLTEALDWLKQLIDSRLGVYAGQAKDFKLNSLRFSNCQSLLLDFINLHKPTNVVWPFKYLKALAVF